MLKNDNATQQAKKQNEEGHNLESANMKQVELPGTIEELQNLLQVEGDKRVTQALKTAYNKWQRELLERLKAERNEAGRLAKLSVEKHEKEILEKYKKKIEEKERALKQKELEINVIYRLAERRLPIEFKDFILGQDEEDFLKRIDRFCKLWEEKLNEAVKAAISGVSG